VARPFWTDILCFAAEYIVAKVSQLPAWRSGRRATLVHGGIVISAQQNQLLPD
jgi:hypothetical protein